MNATCVNTTSCRQEAHVRYIVSSTSSRARNGELVPGAESLHGAQCSRAGCPHDGASLPWPSSQYRPSSNAPTHPLVRSLQGGDLTAPDGNLLTAQVPSARDCCLACQQLAACGAYTFDQRLCYFKVWRRAARCSKWAGST